MSVCKVQYTNLAAGFNKLWGEWGDRTVPVVQKLEVP